MSRFFIYVANHYSCRKSVFMLQICIHVAILVLLQVATAGAADLALEEEEHHHHHHHHQAGAIAVAAPVAASATGEDQPKTPNKTSLPDSPPPVPGASGKFCVHFYIQFIFLLIYKQYIICIIILV